MNKIFLYNVLTWVIINVDDLKFKKPREARNNIIPSPPKKNKLVTEKREYLNRFFNFLNECVSGVT